MLDNSNFVDERPKNTKSIAYGSFCHVGINLKIGIPGTEFPSKGK